MIQRWDDLTEAEQKRVLLVQNLDDEDMTYLMDYAQYAQVGNCHNLGDEVRELRAKVQDLTLKNELQYRELRYWRNSYDALAYAVALVVSLYGWGGNASYIDGLAYVRKDIEALRQRIRELKGK
jgi:polyhydroxyalkanoate synthesis regulator phasin